EPVKVVKRRVIHAILTAGSHVSGRNAQVLNENAVVRPAAEIADGDVVFNMRIRSATPAAIRTALWRSGLFILPYVVKHAALGTGDNFGDVAHKTFQARHR